MAGYKGVDTASEGVRGARYGVLAVEGGRVGGDGCRNRVPFVLEPWLGQTSRHCRE